MTIFHHGVRVGENKSIVRTHKRSEPTPYSWGTNERFWLTLAPENNTAKFYMVEKVIVWGIVSETTV